MLSDFSDFFGCVKQFLNKYPSVDGILMACTEEIIFYEL
jgi:hypothetical protein